jgi:hypothetical protein
MAKSHNEVITVRKQQDYEQLHETQALYFLVIF